MEYYGNNDWRDYHLAHHGILGQKWGKKNGPPYPLGVSDHSVSEKKAGWKQSLSGSGKKGRTGGRTTNYGSVSSGDPSNESKPNAKALKEAQEKWDEDFNDKFVDIWNEAVEIINPKLEKLNNEFDERDDDYDDDEYESAVARLASDAINQVAAKRLGKRPESIDDITPKQKATSPTSTTSDSGVSNTPVHSTTRSTEKKEQKAEIKRKKNAEKQAAKDAKEYVTAKMFHGEGAGVRRREINNIVNDRSKDPYYKEAFEKAVQEQDVQKAVSRARAQRRTKDAGSSAKKVASRAAGLAYRFL